MNVCQIPDINLLLLFHWHVHSKHLIQEKLHFWDTFCNHCLSDFHMLQHQPKMLQSTVCRFVFIFAIYIGSSNAYQDPNNLLHLKRNSFIINQQSVNLLDTLLTQTISHSDPGNLRHEGHGVGPTFDQTRVSPVQVPLTLDVSGAHFPTKIQSSFREIYLNKSYYMREQNIELPEEKLDERCFVGTDGRTILSLRRFRATDKYTCSSMCYNIEDWDNLGTSEQTCISFSYCSSQYICILLIKTDYNFLNKLYNTQNRAIESVNSITKLIREQTGCSISYRNYINNFEGPIRLAPNKFGYKTTERSVLPVNHEWLASFRIMQPDYDQDFHSRCADRCHEMNNRSTGRTCLAIDFCTRYYFEPQQKKREKRSHEITCNLFLVDLETVSGFGGMEKLDTIRRVLRSPNSKTLSDGSHSMEDAQLCSRFLLSHLHEFNHMADRKLSGKFAESLQRCLPSLKDISLEKCSSECSLMESKCFIFEYCSVFDQETTKARTTCKLFGRPSGSVEKTKEEANDSLLSSYSQDCHIYVQRNVGSLRDVYWLRSPAWGYSLDDFYTTIFGILLLLFPLILSLILVVKDGSTDRQLS